MSDDDFLYPILIKGDLLLAQDTNGDYGIYQRGKGKVQDVEDPSEEFLQGLRDVGFVNP